MLNIKIFSLFTVCTILGTVYCGCWTTYNRINHAGRPHSRCTGDGQCTTFTTPWKSVVNSINTRGGCARLWEKRGCVGKHLDLRPGSPSHNNIPSLGWGKTWSIGTC